MCDIRFAAAGAKFTTSFARRGLIAEYGISWILPRVVGWGAALDLLLCGRIFLAEEARELGLVKEVLPHRRVDAARDRPTPRTSPRNCAPSSLAVIKQQVYGDAMRDVFDASDRAEKLMHESMLRPDFIEGITAFFEKRQPNFPPLTLEQEDIAMTLDYRAIDVDNHYYEPIDSFTRHLPKEFKRRGVQMLTEGKRTFAVMGGVVNHFIPNPTFDPIIEPGCLDLLFRGEIPEGVDPASLMKVDRLANHPEYQNRDARVKILDKQNLETVFMLPTFACGVEEALKHDIEATMASVHAFNLWLDEDWGFDRPDHRIHLGADHLAGRSGQGRRGGRVRAGARRQDGAGAARAGARRGQAAFAGRSAARPGVGPAGRSRCSGGLPPVRQRLPRDRGAVGRQGARSRDSARRTRSTRSCSTTARSTTRWPR